MSARARSSTPSRPTTPRSASQAWNDIETEIENLTTHGSRTRNLRPVPKTDHEAAVAKIGAMLARLRARQEQLLAFLNDPTPSANAAFTAVDEGDTDIQKLRRTIQDNTMKRTQIYQDQRLLAETESESLRLTQQVDEAQRCCDSLEQQSLRQEPAAPAFGIPVALAEARTEVARWRERLTDIERRKLGKEALLNRAKQELAEDELRATQTTAVKANAKSAELRRELQGVEEFQVVYATEVADCHARLGAAATERRELEQRLQLLRMSQDQITQSSSALSAEASALRAKLAQTKAECQRQEEQAQREAEELAQLKLVAAPQASQASRSPPEVSRRPSQPQALEAHPDLVEQLKGASAHNDWLRDQLQQLSGGRPVPGFATPAASSSPALPMVAPPETAPEVARPHLELMDTVDTTKTPGEPEMDSTILALEAQMRALQAGNKDLEKSFAWRTEGALR